MSPKKSIFFTCLRGNQQFSNLKLNKNNVYITSLRGKLKVMHIIFFFLLLFYLDTCEEIIRFTDNMPFPKKTVICASHSVNLSTKNRVLFFVENLNLKVEAVVE